MKKLIVVLAALLLVTLPLISACGGDEEDETPTPTATAAPTPTPTPSPTPTILYLLDQALSKLPDYAEGEAQMLRQEALSNGTVTQKELDSITTIVSDPLFLTVSEIDDLTSGFDSQNLSSLLSELGDMPYSNYLMANLDKLGQLINGKVRTEDDYGYKPDIRQMHGTYIFGKHEEGKLLLPLDNESLSRLYPDKEKKDNILKNLWFVPDWSYSAELAKELGLKAIPVVGYEAQKKNLESLQEVYDAITRAYENPESYVHKESRWGYNQWLSDRANHEWQNTVEAFREIDMIISSDPQFGKLWDMIKFIYGYARRSAQEGFLNLYWGHEAYMTSMLTVPYQAFGVPVSEAVSAPSDGLQVGEFVVAGIPHHIMDEVRTKLNEHEIVDFGNYGISLYSSKVPMIKDGAKKLVYGLRAGEETRISLSEN